MQNNFSHTSVFNKQNLGFGISAFVFAILAEKFPLNITAVSKNNKAEIRITGALYGWNNSSEEITSKIDTFIEDGIVDVDVFLNCPGGDVFEAAEIENQIQRFTGLKKGVGGALVASAATKIAMSLDSFEMAENGQFMYHKPSAYISGNEDKIVSSLKLLQTLTTQYKDIYAEKSTNTADEIESNWAKGDVWLSAKEALEQKFITGVIKKTTITPDTKAMFEACGSPTIPKITNHKKPNNVMDQKILALSLGLPEDASEETIKAAIKALKEAGQENTALKAEKVSAETTQTDAKIDKMLKEAITAKKINAEQVEGLKGWAKNDFTACESHINSLPTLGKVSDEITPGANGNTKDFSAMSDKEKQTMAEDNPEAFKASYFASLETK